MYCSNCGKPIEDECNFCKYCGTKITISTNNQTNSEVNHIEKSIEKIVIMDGLKLDEDGVKKLSKQNLNQGEFEYHYIHCYTEASLGQFMLYGGFAGFETKQYILNFTNKGIHMNGLSMFGKLKGYSFVQYDAIKSLCVKDAFLGLQKKIVIEFKQGGKITFKVNKKVLGISEQGNNLKQIENKYQK
jgi:DNA-directed RNA polymerase subunit RPC12/RpoP